MAASSATYSGSALLGTANTGISLANREKAIGITDKGPQRENAAALVVDGSPRRVRTADPVINSHLLYR